jgi:hypothetical protein
VDNFVDKADMAPKESLLLIKTDHRQPKVKEKLLNKIRYLQNRCPGAVETPRPGRFVHNSAVDGGLLRFEQTVTFHAVQHEVNVNPHHLR